MALKTLVKISQISNLSDARYCAGMGVEILGFCLDETHPKYVDLAKAREISLWISGVKIAGEFQGENTENMNYLAENMPLDYVQLNFPVPVETLKKIHKPKLMALSIDQYSDSEIEKYLDAYKGVIDYYIIESEKLSDALAKKEQFKNWCSAYKIILGAGVNIKNIEQVLNQIQPAGIEIKGGEEIKPGLKNFDELSEILEFLETE